MIIADYTEYFLDRIVDQKDRPLCRAFAFSRMLEKHVKQRERIDVIFDPEKVQKEVNAYVKAYKGSKDSNINWNLKVAMEKGFVSENGYRVFVTGGKNISFTAESLARALNMYGVLQFGIKIYKGFSLYKTDGNGVLFSPVKNKIESWHSMLITGYDARKNIFKWQNSRPASKALRWIKGEDLESILHDAFVIYGTKTKKI